MDWFKQIKNKNLYKKRKSQINFEHYLKKIEAQAKKWFSYKKKSILSVYEKI